MCLAVPMKVLTVENGQVRCSAFGTERQVPIGPQMVDPVEPGDYVIISLGMVAKTPPEAEAEQSLALFREILEATGGLPE